MQSMADINSSALPTSTKSGPAETPAAGTHQPSSPVARVAETFSYKECRKNHAAAYGIYALDGCCEFMPSGPAWLICAACSCHRSFHRPERLEGSASPDPLSPTPLSVRYPPKGDEAGAMQAQKATSFQREGRKRFRTKFTPQQKEMMHEFAEEVGWKLRRVDGDKVAKFCNQVGIEKRVLKVWMHNNKYTLAAKMAADLNDNPTGDNAGNSGCTGGVDASDGDKKSSPSSGGTDE